VLLSESEFSSIKFPMHTALIFKEQMDVQGLREKGLSQPYYSIQHIEGYDLLCFKDKIHFPQSLRQRVLSWYLGCLLHPGETCTEQTIRNTMTLPGLKQDVKGSVPPVQSINDPKRNARNMVSCLPKQQDQKNGS
jgi:hypothetical protein